MPPISKKFTKKQGYYWHSWQRAFQRYFVAMDKKCIKIIVEAIKNPNPYLPVKLLQDWEKRQKWEIEYMGTKMKCIYDKEEDTLVTFLPWEEHATSTNTL